jgi:hypothetical protein
MVSDGRVKRLGFNNNKRKLIYYLNYWLQVARTVLTQPLTHLKLRKNMEEHVYFANWEMYGQHKRQLRHGKAQNLC